MINFSSELSRAVSDAAEAFMHRKMPDLPCLSWTYGPSGLSGYVREFEHDDVEAVAQQWRAAFSLDEGIDYRGSREYSGVYDHEKICIWYITNRERFENGSR